MRYDQRPPANPRPRTSAEEVERQRRAIEIWRSARAIKGTPGERYLRSRAIMPDRALYLDSPDGWPETIRWSDDVFLSPAPPAYPGICFAINDRRTGLVCSIHRIPFRAGQPIRRDGRVQKLSLGPTAGNAFQGSCWPDPEGLWGIAEGIETALAATQLYRFGVWSSVSAGNLERVAPPSWAREITIFADHDDPGRRAAYRTFSELRLRYPKGAVRVARARAPGSDLNDVLKEVAYAAS
jgi:putative DNA primase/helicase